MTMKRSAITSAPEEIQRAMAQWTTLDETVQRVFASLVLPMIQKLGLPDSPRNVDELLDVFNEPAFREITLEALGGRN